jgi:hypothetical protein
VIGVGPSAGVEHGDRVEIVPPVGHFAVLDGADGDEAVVVRPACQLPAASPPATSRERRAGLAGSRASTCSRDDCARSAAPECLTRPGAGAEPASQADSLREQAQPIQLRKPSRLRAEPHNPRLPQRRSPLSQHNRPGASSDHKPRHSPGTGISPRTRLHAPQGFTLDRRLRLPPEMPPTMLIEYPTPR